MAPEEPSQDHGKNSQIIEDFQALRKTAEDMNQFKTNQLFFLLHLAHIIAMESIAWFTIFHFGNDQSLLFHLKQVHASLPHQRGRVWEGFPLGWASFLREVSLSSTAWTQDVTRGASEKGEEGDVLAGRADGSAQVLVRPADGCGQVRAALGD